LAFGGGTAHDAPGACPGVAGGGAEGDAPGASPGVAGGGAVEEELGVGAEPESGADHRGAGIIKEL
jgi:hypothetical protein